jgi:hypothetical protein
MGVRSVQGVESLNPRLRSDGGRNVTYQELLVEFDRRRANPPVRVQNDGTVGPDFVGMIADLQWAIQAILEKLRETEPLGPEAGSS